MPRVSPVVPVVPLVIVLGLMLACGSDDDGAESGDDRGTESNDEGTTMTTAAEPTPAEGVTLSAEVRSEDSQLLFDFTLTNTGVEPAAVVDPATVSDRTEQLDEGSFRFSYLRSEVYGEGGSPLPFLLGKVVPAAGDLRGTVLISGRWDQLPETVQLCIEVVPQPWTDKGDGVAEFPYRGPDSPPVSACTDRLSL